MVFYCDPAIGIYWDDVAILYARRLSLVEIDWEISYEFCLIANQGMCVTVMGS